MTEDTTTDAATDCAYCHKPVTTPTRGVIVDQDRDPITRKKYVRRRTMTFCSERCLGHYQMSCEG